MTKPIPASSVSSPSTTASAFAESARRTLAAVPETRGTSVVVLEPVMFDAPLPADFIDVDVLVEREEKDPVAKQAISEGRKSVAENYYDTQPRALAYYRLKNGWSQKELAERMHTSQSYIARLEAGAIDPQVSTLTRLATVLDIAASELLDVLTKGARKS